ncbi:MAG: M56 family metallopeptidase, partial [Bryobacteraceae bacterium]
MTSGIPETAAAWIASSWPSLIDHLWQTSLFAAVVLLLYACLGRAPAHLRHSLLFAIVVRFALPSELLSYVLERAGLMPLLLWQNAAGTALIEGPLLETIAAGYRWIPSASPRAHDSDVILLSRLAALWLAGFASIFALQVIRHARLTSRLRREAKPAGDREQSMLRSACRRLGIRGEIRLLDCAFVTEPAAWGLWRPAVLLPKGVSKQLTGEELETVLMHEAAHIRRRDNLASCVEAFVFAAFWFHPLTWWLNRRLRAEREMACDEAVLASGAAADAYVSAIAKICRATIAPAVAGLSSA